MTSAIGKIKVWSSDQTVRGLVPYLALVLVLFLINQRYDYQRTGLDDTIDGLEPRTLYLRKVGAEFCAGDIVTFRSAERKQKYYRKVIAGSGSIFSLTDNGYQINEATQPMGLTWLVKARLEMGDRDSIEIPSGHVLFVNTEFATKSQTNFWAFETVPRENVTERFSHILFSRDFSRIGERVGTDSPDCIR